MRSSLLLVPFVLTACVEGDVALFGCPDDEVCSPDAPDGLGFFGAELAGDLSLQPVATALGGTQSVTLKKKVGDQFFTLSTSYVASGGSVLDIESTEGPVVTFRATGEASSGTLVIRDVDDQLLDRKSYPVHPLARIDVVPEHIEGTDLPFAFLAGDVRLGIGLHSAPNADGFETRLVDEAMLITHPGTRVAWDLIEIAEVAPGPLSFTVAAAGQDPVVVDALIVPAVEQLVDHPDEAGYAANASNTLCFDAVSAEHHVAGLTWTVASDNGTVEPFLSTNCFFVTPAIEGAVTITAQAGGVTEAVSYAVAAAQSKPRLFSRPRSTPEGVIAAASSSR